MEPEAPETAEEAIRDAFSSIKGYQLKTWVPLTVPLRNGSAHFLACQKRQKAFTEPAAAIHLVAITTGRLWPGLPVTYNSHALRLTGKNELKEIGPARLATPELLSDWAKAGLPLADLTRSEQKESDND